MQQPHANGNHLASQMRSDRAARAALLSLMLGIVASLLLPTFAQAAVGDQSLDGVWTQIDATSLPVAVSKAEQIMPTKYSLFEISDDALEGILGNAPREFSGAAKNNVILTLPMPDGSFESFAIQESPILSEQMQEWNPDIKTYMGQGIDDRTATVRFDMTMFGFRAMILSSMGAVMIDPVQLSNTDYLMSYFKSDFPLGEETFECSTPAEELGSKYLGSSTTALANGDELTTYRMVVTATGEYTEYFGGVSGAVAQITTTFNRVNEIYERDVAVRFNIVRTIVFTDPDTDPFATGDTVNSALLNENQTVTDDSVGSGNYDIGHIVSQGGPGGYAPGDVCNNSNKAKGGTSRSNPFGDPFDVDYVSHEVGHQMGGDHTFNAISQYSCTNSTRTGSSAYEPGSGSTIMAYAGICGNQDLQPHSDPYFHVRSLEQIINKVGSAGCGSVTPTGNNPPTANAQTDWTIPTQTPFKLTGVGTDSDGDSLTYCWEQYDLGDPEPPIDFHDGPLFRSLLPTTSPSRTFPNLDSLLDNLYPAWENLPVYDRDMHFRLTVRDNHAGGGGVDWDEMTVTVAGDPFFVTSPNGGESYSAGCPITVTWVVGGGDIASDVNIWLSTDGGYTLDHLLANTANDGSAEVTLPCGVDTDHARILIAAAGNIFFDVSDADFTIEAEAPQFTGSTTGGSVDGDCQKLVTFSATITDDCSLLASDVDVSVNVTTGNASLDTPIINKVQSDGTTVNVTGSVLVYALTGSPATVQVSYEASDNCGTTDSASYSADVVDEIPPVITCPSDLTFECDSIGDFGFPTATDNCDSDPAIAVTSIDSIPGDCPQEYQLVLTYRASDDAGNTASCQQTITVEDTTPPEIECPDTLEFVFVSPTRAQVIFDITATDNCADTLEIVSDSASGSVFVLGEHTISASVDDGCGNTDSCSFSFRLAPLDIHPTSCPNPLNARAGGANILLAKSGPIADIGDDDPQAFSGPVVPVAILGTSDLDVKDIDVSSLRFEGIAPVNVHYEDVATPIADEPGESCRCTTAGPDGYLDLVLHFDRRALVTALGTVYDGDEIMLTLTGAMSDGILLAGGDCVVIRGPKPVAFDYGLKTEGEVEGYAVRNIPNPFNPSTTISYHLPTAGEVSLVVYNVMGQEVKTLVDSYQAAGQHSVEWQGENGFGQRVSSGMYFYRLQVGNVSITRKMMLLK
jgi:hypothetical protein